MRDMGELYGGDSLESGSGDLGSEYTHDLLLKYQLKDEEMFELFDYCKSKDMLFMCTPWDISSFLKLEEYGVSAYKVASADFTNYDLLAEISQTGKLMFCSTGMSGESEIQSTISFLNKYDANYILLHCNSTYPAPFKDINLKYLNRLKDGSGNIVGYSGHERGSDIVIAAVALGAKVIEKHFTLDKTLEGNDHKVSLTPRELKKMVESIRNTEDSLGYSSPRSLTQGEMINRQVLSKSLIVNCSIKKGDFISREMIDIRSPGNGVQPNRLSEIVGTYAKRNFKSGEVIFDSDIKGAILRKEEYDFSRPYGIPVRFHDFYQLTKGVKLDFVEFHLSYKDLEVDPSRIFSGVSNMGFAVHSPELFISDHLMDLSAFDDQYRLNSIKALEQVIEMTNNLMQYFKQNTPPVVVINAGGWSRSGFLSDSEKTKKYALIKDALSAVNSENVIIAIQTMPPFPWHFGGQSYHNLFVDPHEIVGFCKDVPVKICLDVSHSMMACSHYGWDLYDFVSLIAPYTVHLHIVDALGSDGEGIQIGDGDVDFDKLLSILDDKLIDIPFIPEVWQGHQDHGQGFWYALDFLERHGY